MAQWEGLELMVTRQVWRTSDGHSGKLSEVNLGDGHGWRSVAPVLHDLGIQV